MLLIGDIGGTKTILAAFTQESGARAPLKEARFNSQKYVSLEEVITEFLRDNPQLPPVEKAVFGVAGPVIRGEASVTNLPWFINGKQIQDVFHIHSVTLLNDLTATAHAIPHLQVNEVYTLHEGEANLHGNIGVIAPGTGLGEAFLIYQPDGYQVHPSEGGHASFAPTSAIEVELLSYLMERYEHVSYERVCSGIGIPNIYAFLKESGYYQEPAWLMKQLAATEQPTAIIVQAAFSMDESQCAEICTATIDLFVSILGNEAGNLAVKVMATGGIYLGGGIPPRILSRLKGDLFLDTLHSKGRFSEILAKIPVKVILNANAALLGATYYGLHQHVLLRHQHR